MRFPCCTLFALQLVAHPVVSFQLSKTPSISAPPSAFSTSNTAVFQSTTTATDDVVDVSSLPPPPKKKGFLRNLRDSIGYFKDPDGYLLKRSQELDSPVFEMYQFFKPVVVVGGQEAVKEFISQAEAKNEVIYPSLPDTFLDLHTEWGALNLDSNDQRFKEARQLFGDVLPPKYHVPELVPQIEAYVDQLAERVASQGEDEPVYLVPELIRLCLNMFTKNFSGKDLTDEQAQQFIDYNAGLLSFGEKSKSFVKAKAALEELKAEMLARFQALENAEAGAPGKWYFDQVSNRVGFAGNEDRIGTGIVLFVWGAYVEASSLMIDAMALMKKHGIDPDIVYKEYQQQKKLGYSESDARFWNFPFTNGILRETLRLEPPGAGVPRYGNQDFSLAGYKIEAGTPVVMDPRIGNNDPSLYENPEEFQPLRWLPLTESNKAEATKKCPFAGTAQKLGPGSWFPGGNGAHKCPGVPLAETTATIFLAKMVERFESWEFSGSGLKKDGEIDYVKIPVKICPDDFGLRLKLRRESKE